MSAMILRPRAAHWLPLLIPMIVPTGLAGMLIAQRAFAGSLVCIAFVLWIVGYNGLTRLTIDSHVAFSRYGRQRWRIGIEGVRVSSGRMGEIPIVPAFVLRSPAGQTGTVPKGMLAPADIDRLHMAIVARGGTWSA